MVSGYGVLHSPDYRDKYATHLRREFPRIPFYSDFWQWADWGDELIRLHTRYDAVEPFPLARQDRVDERARVAKLAPKVLLKADKESGHVIVDSETLLIGVPLETWEYRLGNRSALEWILEQYKAKKPKRGAVSGPFLDYNFADHKEAVIDLIGRVTAVSVRTIEIVRKMRAVQAETEGPS